ncbi:stage II sporulation protein R [Bacillus solimangrovi]|uniref:Stage II sporulation protein R n=1 Tax=Bacillus solimangrovi TaxID=1305675 RepID=A0A1E5LGU6_9BACI|nr:stage II sporulation protein R [Bacillus solimangrovi]OEH93300.1 stage II sporulation protein R [Bacillus solimangrovi]
MRKLAIIYFILSYVGVLLFQQFEVQASESNQYDLRIPQEAIRLRILANSDSIKDQQLKRAVRDAVNQEINQWVENLSSIEEARTLIKENDQEIAMVVNDVLAEKQSDQVYKVEIKNAEFPTKMYGQYIYPAGTYEAVVITLGEGKGANWWCVLFPPLCFLDFSNSDAVAAETTEDQSIEEEQEPQVKFFILEWLKNLFTS